MNTGTNTTVVTPEMLMAALRAFRVPKELALSGRRAGKTAAAMTLALEAAMAVAPRQAVPDGVEKDAERYRWLRDKAVFHEDGDNPTPWVINGVNIDSFDRAPVYGVDLDAVIDSILADAPSSGRMGVAS